MKLLGIAAGASLGAAMVSTPAALGASFHCGHILDTFTGPDSSFLGPPWSEPAPPIGITHNAAMNPTSNSALAVYKGVHSKQVCADVVANGPGLQYAAIVLGYKNPNNNIFIKVQDNFAGGAFNRVFAYRGNNGSGGALASGSDSRGLKQFVAAELHVSWTGSTVEVDISSSFNNKAQQKFIIHGVHTAGLGKKIGIGLYGGAYLDNFAIP